MSSRLLPLVASTLALAVASGAVHAQARQQPRQDKRSDARMLPVLNKANGKLEAVLMLEPAAGLNGSNRWQFGGTTLEATFGLQSGNSLALLCDRRSGMAPAIGQLAGCVLASLDGGGNNSTTSRYSSAGLNFTRPGAKAGVSVGSGHDLLPAWLSPGALGGARYNQKDVSLFAEKSWGGEGFVNVGGTVARARLIPATEVPQLADQWNSRSLSIGGGYGNFGASIIGRIVNVPGESDVWKGVGLGLTWRTPWNGQLSIGADNVITRGKNPFAPKGSESDEGTVPYVRYQQDL
ncbi:hypothetical protein [Thermomonas alba]|uniref:XOO1806 family protein n=1 Tax=Thermomonas alba TaxID=2888525 RepID=UPI001F037592|nr:hypothetical protein [Thermomonas alba]